MNNTQFEWQADEDEDLSRPSPQTEGPDRNKRLWFVIGFILLVAIVTLLLVRFFNQRQQQLEEEIRQDVRASFRLWQEAVERKDSELYAHLLAVEDGNWRRIQNRLFMKDMILERPFLGLSLRSETSFAPEIELAPDWQQATVAFEQIYAPPVTGDFSGVVRLHHTAVYELHDSTWLQIPPDETFWGAWQTYEGDLLTVRYPARDAGVARRISRQLEADLQAVCFERKEDGADDDHLCARVQPFILNMSTELDSLDALDSAMGPTLYGAVYQLPTPTLVGLPVDELSYQAFYQGYTRKIVEDVRTAVNPPLPLPQQVIRTLCFDHPNVGPQLYMYDPAQGFWLSELPDRSFRFLERMPDYQGVILHEIGVDRERNHSRLVHWQAGTEKLLLQEITNELPYRVISSANDGSAPYLLLQRRSTGQATDDYGWLDLQSCDETGCDIRELSDYALWSPNGQRALLLHGSEIHLADRDGRRQEPVGIGFSPFWLDDNSFVYFRFAQRSSGLTAEVVMAQTTNKNEQILFDSNDLANHAGIEEGDLFIRYVTDSPAESDLLLVNASGVRDHAGEYFVFTVRLPARGTAVTGDDILLQLQRKGSPGADLSLLTPTGFLPFLPSPDGRWLLIGELTGGVTGSWAFLLHDLERNHTNTITDDYPFFPAQFPSYDWSRDGRWLVIADDGFFRLLAPEQAYEQLIAHDFDYCINARWSDR